MQCASGSRARRLGRHPIPDNWPIGQYPYATPLPIVVPVSERPTHPLFHARRIIRFATRRPALEITCWILGIGLCAAYAAASTDRSYHSERDVAALVSQLPAPDQSSWSRSRIDHFNSSLEQNSYEAIGVLRIPALRLEVPVYPRQTALALNRGTALIEGMSQPDRGGNTGVAGHRDGFFRVLKDIQPGVAVELLTRRKLHRYRVTSVFVVDARDNAPLADTDEPSITLVTCYPFYYIGNAPERFIVRATYDWSAPEPE
jgi:sortase A